MINSVLGKVRPGRVARGLLRRLRKARGRGASGPGRSRASFLTSIATTPEPEPAPLRPTIRAAVAAGDRIRAGFAWEWDQIDLKPRTWRAELANDSLDLVLVEITRGTAPGWNQQDLFELLDWTTSRRVRTVAWVTTGPEEATRAEHWIEKVDHVFVTREEDLRAWRERWPQTRLALLGPAAQPRTHNPHAGAGNRREMAAALIVDDFTGVANAVAALPANRVDVWPANAGVRAAAEAGGLAHELVPITQEATLRKALARYSVLTEFGGPDHVSWNMVEAASAQGSIVVAKAALPRVPPCLREAVVVAETDEELRYDLAARVWQRELRDREGVQLSRAVYSGHTYKDRVEQIAGAVGLSITRPRSSVSAIVSTNRSHAIDNVLLNIGRQAHTEHGRTELVLVLHGLDVKPAEVEAKAADAGVDNVTIIAAASDLTLGACLNLGLDAASGDYVAKMDDDNFYGRHYLTDLVTAFGYTDAGIVGKWAHYVWLRSTDAVVLRCGYAEHRPERLVQGGTIVMAKDVADDLRFEDLPRGVDTDLLNRANDAGVLTYSADRFNFVSIRGTDRQAHTWTIADAALMNKAGNLVFYGDPRHHVEA